MNRCLGALAAALWLAGAAHAADPFAGKAAGLYRGVVVQVDLSNRQLTLDTPAGKQTIGLPAKAHLFRGKDRLTHDKLKPGDDLRFSWYRDDAGVVQANRIKYGLAPETEP